MYGSHSDTQLGSTEIFSVLVGFHQNCDQGLLLGIVTEVNNCYYENILLAKHQIGVARVNAVWNEP